MIKGLYVHIPFCDQICTYCDFCKMVASESKKREYMKALIKEMEYYNDLLARIETIYIGGGTPSSIDIDLMDAFLDELETLVDMTHIKEFTIEANPNDVNEAWLDMVKKHHVTRVSMGVQTMNEDLLKFLGRTHNAKKVNDAIKALKASHLEYNLDFLYAIPNQTEEDLKNDLSYIDVFDADHISYYSLILEDKTLLSHMISNHKVNEFDDDLARDYGEIVDSYLADFGYEKYEFSNYAKPNHQSLHNLIYWNLEEYLGIGLNASSQFNNSRMVNPKTISEYLSGIKDKSLTMHRLEDFNPEMEILLVGLRRTKGVSLSQYKKRFKHDVFDVFPQLKKYLDQHLLEIKDDYMRLTNDGVYLSNQVFMDLI